MTAIPKPLAHAVACALGSCMLAPLPAYALMITTTGVDFSNSATVTDTEGGGATTNNGASLGTSSISQFDPNLGVLMGATLNLTSDRTQSVNVASTAGGGTGANSNVISNGTGSSTVNISAPGVDITYSSLSANDSCAGKWKNDCNDGATTNTDHPSLSGGLGEVPSANLNSYVGISGVTVTRAAPTLEAQQSNGVFSGTESTASTLTWSGNVGATYEYLLHADAVLSFRSEYRTNLNLDFGTLSLGSAAPNLDFDIFNVLGERVGLDLDVISGTGDTNRLTTDLDLFYGLVAGQSNAFIASFDTSSAGKFAASYVLTLSDADVGAAASRLSYTLTLNLAGEVIEDDRVTETVPEPASIALLGLGIAGIGLQRRKTKP